MKLQPGFYSLVLAVLCVLCANMPHLANGADRSTLNFLVIGDWGTSEAHNHQPQVAEAMARVASATPVDFIVTTGDNFYEGEDGSRTVTSSPAFERLFENYYSSPSLNGIPWYPTLGDHDYENVDFSKELAYTHSSSNKAGRWSLENTMYVKSFSINKRSKAHFVFLDTNPFTIEKEMPPLLLKDAPILRSNEIAKLERELSQFPTNEWIVAFGHHALRAAEGTTPITYDVRAPLADIFRKHHITTYFCGHNHSLQHTILKTPAVIHNFVSAGGGSPLGSATIGNPEHGDEWAVEKYGFIQVSLSADAMAVTYWDGPAKRIITGFVLDR